MAKKHSSNKIPLLVLGDFAWDVLIRTNSKLLPGGDTFGEVMFAAGGSAANTAVWARRCGMPTTFVGKIGRDRFGRLAEENLAWEQVEAHFIKTDEHRTAAVAVWIDEKGQRSMVSGRGADFYLLSSELPKNLLQNSRHLYLTAWSLFTDPPRTAARMAAEIVKSSGGTVSLDPASFQLIRQRGTERCLGFLKEIQPDLFFPNYEEGQALTGQDDPDKILDTLIGYFPGTMIVLKLDAKGAILWDRKVKKKIPPQTDTIIDATGAGDSFSGAFLAHYLQNGAAESAAHFAVKISSWVINQIGARPQPDQKLKTIIESAEEISS